MANNVSDLKFVDLFCGIGGFRLALENAARKRGQNPLCVYSSDIDKDCCISYEANFEDVPDGDIKLVDENTIPDHDFLLAGFPCQTFSIIGSKQGFEDKLRGTLFFDVIRIMRAKKPKVAILENVRGLVGHNGGKTLGTIMKVLKDAGYAAQYRVLNALDFGLPHKRERIFIVAVQGHWPDAFKWPSGGVPMKPLAAILEPDEGVPKECWASDYIRTRRHSMHTAVFRPSIWHENKSGNISSHPFSCALRANASHNYILVNGDRRLTSREMLRLQGFPDNYKIVCSHAQTRKQAGNALPVPVAQSVILSAIDAIYHSEDRGDRNEPIGCTAASANS